MPYQKKKSLTAKKKPDAKKKTKPRYRKKVTWVNPSLKTNQTVQVCFRTEDAKRKYFTVESLKQNQLTTTFQINDTISETLADNISSDARLATLFDNFRWYRVYAIKVKLIPEKYQAAVLVDNPANGLLDGEKPKIHWILDDGSAYVSAARWTTDDLRLTIPEAETHQKYHTREFTKDMTFWIRPYRKNLSIESDSYVSANTWTPTSVQHLATDLNYRLPNYNLIFGFTDVPPEFKYRTEIDYYFCLKDMKATAG